MIWTSIFIALLLIAYKGLVYWMNRQAASLAAHNRELREKMKQQADARKTDAPNISEQ